jgi:hypothetical protein
MMKEGIGIPGLFVESNTSESGWEVEMDVAFEVASESMDREEDARCEVLRLSKLYDDISSNEGYFFKEMSVEPEEIPEFRGQCESDMLVSGFWKGIEFLGNPLIGTFFTTRGAESGFTGVRNLSRGTTGFAAKEMESEQWSTTGEHFQDINNDIEADVLVIFEEEFPPVAIMDKDVTNFNGFWWGDFHQPMIGEGSLFSNKKFEQRIVARRA